MATQPEKQLNISLQQLSLEDDKGTESTSTPLSPTAKKPKPSCLCAPTTHAGSFRCRRHRNSASVGSNLSELANKRTASVGANLSELDNNKRSREC
nr:hypothetical protein [Tanacetum cinerariifolium]